MEDDRMKANLTPEEKQYLDGMMACSRASYNEAVREIGIFITEYKGEEKDLESAMLDELTRMSDTKKDFDWELFKKYYNELKPFEGSDTEKHVMDALAKYPDDVRRFKEGRIGLIGKFMGEVMKTTRGEAEPKLVNTILRDKLKA